MLTKLIGNEVQGQYISDPLKWIPVIEALQKGELERVEVPIAKPQEHRMLLDKLQSGLLSNEDHQKLSNTHMNLDIHFDGHEDVMDALKQFQGAILQVAGPSKLPVTDGKAPQVLNVPNIATGAAIGGVGGLGVSLILQGLKSTTDMLANPLVGTIGMVLVGMAAGAVGGVMGPNLINVTVKAKGIELKLGLQPAS